MAKIQYCTCRVNLSGQNCHIVKFDQFDPVTWPEVQVLMALHADENVMDVVPVALGETTHGAEKERLAGKYGYRIVEQCFPGRNFRMAMMMTDDDKLPVFVEGGISTKVNDDDDVLIDGGEEAARLAAQTPSFSPGRHKPTATPKEA